jgi:hypothetical protein
MEISFPDPRVFRMFVLYFKNVHGVARATNCSSSETNCVLRVSRGERTEMQTLGEGNPRLSETWERRFVLRLSDRTMAVHTHVHICQHDARH